MRFIILYSNGKLIQQKGLNLTYLHLHSIGLIKMIIDVVTGEYIGSDRWEWCPIETYNDSSLIVNPIPENNE